MIWDASQNIRSLSQLIPNKGVIQYCRLVYVEKFTTEQLDPSPLINLGSVSQLPLSSYMWKYEPKFRRMNIMDIMNIMIIMDECIN